MAKIPETDDAKTWANETKMSSSGERTLYVRVWYEMENDAHDLKSVLRVIQQWDFCSLLQRGRLSSAGAGTKINCYPWKCLYCT